RCAGLRTSLAAWRSKTISSQRLPRYLALRARKHLKDSHNEEGRRNGGLLKNPKCSFISRRDPWLRDRRDRAECHDRPDLDGPAHSRMHRESRVWTLFLAFAVLGQTQRLPCLD